MARAKRGDPSSVGPLAPTATAAQLAPATGPDGWDKLTILDRLPGHFAVARWRNVFIQAWAAQADAAAMARVQAVVSGKNGPRFGVRSSISIVNGGLPLPTDEARAGFTEMLSDKAKEIVCVAVILNGTGFTTSALRSMLTGMRLAVARSASYEMGVFGEIEEIGPWLPPRHYAKTGVTLEATRLCEVVREAQSAAATGR